jgi:probable F420-dependent oxidoreductase
VIKFGVSVPTCKEGLNLPLPFADGEAILGLIQLADELGFDSVWGNDHITPPAYVRRDFPDPPNFYEPLVIFAAAAGMTSRVKLGPAVLVLPFREPVFLAKQLATLDRVSGGRLILAVGTGAYREEFESLYPRLKGAHRGRMLDEGIEALHRLFTQRRAHFEGEYYAFDGIELYPKPVQDPLPIFMGGNSSQVIQRAAERGQGWMPAAVSAEEIGRGRQELHRLASAAGRDPQAIDIAPQVMCCMARTHEEAVARFRASRMYVHLQTLSESTLRGKALGRMEEINLVGSPDEVVERIGKLAEVGVTTLGAMSFLSETKEIMAEDMAFFASEIMPHFRARVADLVPA